MTNKIYIAGPMSGIAHFNFPAFNKAAKDFREQGFEVFNPAERDIERHGEDISICNPTGDQGLAKAQYGFSLRDALYDDLSFITKHATHIHMLRGWEKSLGARAEHATATALGLEISYQSIPEAA